MLQDKDPEVSVCNASLIRNVWEIRTKTYSKRVKTEEDRVKKSALPQINQEWQDRMTSERKAPPRLQQISMHTENTEHQNYLNKPQFSYMSRNTEFSNSKLQKQKGLFSKRAKNIRDIYNCQPPLLKWEKSWKFSRPQLHMEEEAQAEDVSDWGMSWKFLNIQPYLENQLWSEQDLYDDDLDFLQHKDTIFLSKEAKSNAFLRSQNIENVCLSDWEESWTFSKHPSHEKESLSHEELSDVSMDRARDEDMCLLYGNMLLDSQPYENEMSEWRDSWKVTKPQESDSYSAESETMEDFDDEYNNKTSAAESESIEDVDIKYYQDKTSVSKWSESWMILYHELPKKKSQSSDWSESWKLLQVPSQQEKDIQTDEDLSEETSGIHTFESMLPPKRNKIHILLTSQDFSVSEWSTSWETTKPQNKALSIDKQSMQGKAEGIVDFQSKKEQCVIIKNKPRQFLSPQFFSDELASIGWGESWKFLKPKSCQIEIDAHNDESFFSQMEESWKFAKLQHHIDGEILSKKCKIIEFQNSEWVTSWRFLNLQLNQKKECWDKSWTKYLLYDNKVNVAGMCSENPSKWGNSWKISNPHPPMENGLWLKAKDLHPQNESIFPTKGRCRKSLFSELERTTKQFLRPWSHSWNVLKPHSEVKAKPGKKSFQDYSDLHTYIMTRRGKARCKMLFQLEKEKLSSRKWGDAWRLAKSQPRQKRGSWLNTSKESMNEVKTQTADWSKSWKFFYTQQSEEKSFMSEWEESWKYLLTHQQDRERERSK